MEKKQFFLILNSFWRSQLEKNDKDPQLKQFSAKKPLNCHLSVYL